MHIQNGVILTICSYVKKGINVKRREDLETNDISCIWLEIIQEKGKSFLIGNLYRPLDSRIEYNDRFEDFMDKVSHMGKEIILTGDFNKKKICTDHCDTYWLNFTLSLGLCQLICQPTRVTSNSRTLIDLFTQIGKTKYLVSMSVNLQQVTTMQSSGNVG